MSELFANTPEFCRRLALFQKLSFVEVVLLLLFPFYCATGV